MEYMFVDNFRGFKETLVPIKDVNFFVGENSTGKTSLLALLNLIHSQAFWMGGELSSGGTEPKEVELGNYEDIVSMHAKDKKHFHVGAVTSGGGDERGHRQAFLMRFSDRGGMPVVDRYTFTVGDRKAEVKFEGHRALYKLAQAETVNEDCNTVRGLFLDWLRDQRQKTAGFKELRGLRGFSRSPAVVNIWLQPIMMKGERAWAGKTPFGLAPSWPDMYRRFIWLAPIRTKPLPVYSKYDTPASPEGHHTPYSIKRLLESRETAAGFRRFVEGFGRESGLFESVSIKRYGKRKATPFEVDIALSGECTKITNVGYGVSQALPIIVALFEERAGSVYAIQQPEVHLHPRAQAALGDLLFNAAVMDKKQLVVETHSDFMIDRFRMSFRDKSEKEVRPRSQIVYFENSGEGNILTTLDVDEEGNLPNDQPEGYRGFFLKENLRSLGY